MCYCKSSVMAYVIYVLSSIVRVALYACMLHTDECRQHNMQYGASVCLLVLVHCVKGTIVRMYTMFTLQ